MKVTIYVPLTFTNEQLDIEAKVRVTAAYLDSNGEPQDVIQLRDAADATFIRNVTVLELITLYGEGAGLGEEPGEMELATGEPEPNH